MHAPLRNKFYMPPHLQYIFNFNSDNVKTAVLNYTSRVPNRPSSILVAKSHGGSKARLCLRPLLPPSTRLHPPTKPNLPLRTLDDTTPTLTPAPYTLRNTAFACISLKTTTLLQPENCNRSYIDPTTRLHTRALPRDLRVTTSTTPPTTGRKACHPLPPPIFAPDSASIGSPLLAAAHSYQHVLFRVAIGQDRPIGACLAGFQLGAQTHKAERSAVGSRE